MGRVIVNLKDSEWAALRLAAERDLRDLREQARYLIVKGLAAELATEAQPIKLAQPATKADNGNAA
jgi:hypothetical protein